MSLTVRPFRSSGWEVDIRFRWPDGTPFRERRRAPTSSKSAAQRWGEARERELILAGKPTPERPAAPVADVPTIAEFAPRFMSGYCVANRQKPSGIASKETILRVHLVPRLGGHRLDQVRNEDIQRIKADLAHLNAKTVNNVLSVLGKMLKVAVEWGVVEHLPCRIGLLKVTESAPPWYEPHDYQRLIEGARKCERRLELLVLLGGDAGLRRGEIIGLRWSDVDLERRILLIQRSVWKGHETVPKGGRARTVPMTEALHAALRGHRHLRGEQVLVRDDGGQLTAKVVRSWIERAQRRAGLEVTGAIHLLRHTFCSILAAQGAPAKAIQELAGHADLSTTMRYMHLSPATRESAIRLLDELRDAQPAQGGTLVGGRAVCSWARS